MTDAQLMREAASALGRILARWDYLTRCSDPACDTCAENREIGLQADNAAAKLEERLLRE